MPLVWVLAWFCLLWGDKLWKAFIPAAIQYSLTHLLREPMNRVHSCKESSKRKGQDKYLLPFSPYQALRLRSDGHKGWGDGREDLTNHLHFAQISKATNSWMHTCQAWRWMCLLASTLGLWGVNSVSSMSPISLYQFPALSGRLK